jgi:hypothetical protein
MGAKPRKIQLQSAHLKVGNFKGAFDDLPAFAQPDALSNDMWLYQGVTVTHESVMLRNGDLVMKTIDDSETPFTAANIAAGKWKVIRHLTDDEIGWLTSQMYTPPAATLSGGATLEKNHSALPYAAALSWTTTAGTNAIVTRELHKREGGGAWVKVKDLTGNSGSETVNVGINTDTQFRVLVSSKSGEAVYSPTREVKFQYRTGYRAGEASPAIDSAWMKAGTTAFATSPYRTFTVNAGTGQHIYFYVPKSMVSAPYINPPAFYVGGFEGGFAVHQTDARYALGDGAEVDYVVYRSNQPSLGNTTVTVSAS